MTFLKEVSFVKILLHKLKLRAKEFERVGAIMRANHNWLNVFKRDMLIFKELRNLNLI